MQALEKRLEENLHMERHMEHLQQDLLVIDQEKNQILAKLNKAEQHIEVLTATVDTLSAVSSVETLFQRQSPVC
jgi:uncharacterized protein YoxC